MSDEQEKEFEGLLRQYGSQAESIAIQAFNEGYMLGRKHAERVFGGK